MEQEQDLETRRCNRCITACAVLGALLIICALALLVCLFG